MINKDQKTSHLNKTESKIINLAKPYLQIRNNEIHTLNAIDFAFRLLNIYKKAERRLVIPAMILHDVGWSLVKEEIIRKVCLPDPDKNFVRIHEEESVRIARHILSKIDYDKAETDEILKIIDGHDTRGKAFSINDEIVQDSDKLTRYAINFWFWVGQVTLSAGEYALSLEKYINKWFFLPDSKEMAKKEIYLRLIEIND